MSKPSASDEEILLSGVVKQGGCWLRTLGVRPSTNTRSGGYSRLYRHGKTVYAHRLAFETWVGPIPEGAQIDHLCERRNCIYPAHLQATTAKGNAHHAPQSRKTACPRGHPYDFITSQGRRGCLTCRRDADRNRPSGWARQRARA